MLTYTRTQRFLPPLWTDKCFLVFVICMFAMFFFYIFLRKAENNRLKKASWPKFCNIIFSILLKIGSVGSVDQQINLVSPEWILH